MTKALAIKDIHTKEEFEAIVEEAVERAITEGEVCLAEDISYRYDQEGMKLLLSYKEYRKLLKLSEGMGIYGESL